MRPGENKQILRALSGSWENNKVLGQKFWFVRHSRALQLDRARKGPAVLTRDEHKFSRLLVRGDERAQEICRNATAPAADAGHRPGDRLTQNIFPGENRCEPSWQCGRPSHRRVTIGRSI